MNKSRFLIFAGVLLTGSALMGADPNINDTLLNINSDTHDTIQAGTGVWIKFIIGWIPVLVFFAMAMGTLFYNIKKSEQSQDNDYLKIAGWTFLFAFIGGVVGYAIDLMIGAALLGDSACGGEMFNVYWKESLGMIKPGSHTFNCL